MLLLLILLVVSILICWTVDVKDIPLVVAACLTLFCFFMFLGSVVRSPSSCSKTYAIDYVLYTKLFCEVKDK
jgi:hypothetical protein